jgi:hypothetical protein
MMGGMDSNMITGNGAMNPHSIGGARGRKSGSVNASKNASWQSYLQTL